MCAVRLPKCVHMCILGNKISVSNVSYSPFSATEPLRKSYLTSEFEVNSDISEGPKPRGTTFYRKIDSSDDTSNVVYPNSTKTEQNTENPKDSIKTLGQEPEIHVMKPNDKSHDSPVLGRYTFRPRLKLTNCNQYMDMDKEEREKLYVVNSYKHCSGKSLLPTVLTFDEDPEQFSNKFAQEFLCASTPRQNAKHLSLSQMLSPSIESIDGDF